jgi:hypothetical protein
LFLANSKQAAMIVLVGHISAIQARKSLRQSELRSEALLARLDGRLAVATAYLAVAALIDQRMNLGYFHRRVDVTIGRFVEVRFVETGSCINCC